MILVALDESADMFSFTLLLLSRESSDWITITSPTLLGVGGSFLLRRTFLVGGEEVDGGLTTWGGVCLEAAIVFVSFGALHMAGDFGSTSNSVFTLGVPSVFLLIPLFTLLLQGVSGDIILGLSHVDFDGGETTSGVISCGSMP